jgi:hypothetical protein
MAVHVRGVDGETGVLSGFVGTTVTSADIAESNVSALVPFPSGTLLLVLCPLSLRLAASKARDLQLGSEFADLDAVKERKQEPACVYTDVGI